MKKRTKTMKKRKKQKTNRSIPKEYRSIAYIKEQREIEEHNLTQMFP